MPPELVGGSRSGGASLTSYFCLFSFSPNSYLSNSSWYRVSHSSLALSLSGTKVWGWQGKPGGVCGVPESHSCSCPPRPSP